VTFADLDIATKVGADALKARVRKAAYALCQDLDRLYPMAEQDRSCVKKAEDGSMSQVNAAIRMAEVQGKPTAR
jgi:UrcA family protein